MSILRYGTTLWQPAKSTQGDVFIVARGLFTSSHPHTQPCDSGIDSKRERSESRCHSMIGVCLC